MPLLISLVQLFAALLLITHMGSPTFSTGQPRESSDGEQNLVLNSSMETLVGGYPIHWSRRSSVAADMEIAHSGEVSLRVNGPATATYVYQHLPLQADTAYRLSAWIKTRDVSRGGVGVRYAQLAPQEASWKTPLITQAEDWTEITVEFRTPADHEQGRVDLVWDLEQGGVVWIDNVTLTRKDDASARLDPPVITWTPAVAQGSVQVEIAANPAESEIRYTLDGSRPTHQSPLYTGPLQMAVGQTVQAQAFHPQQGSSERTCAYVGADRRLDGEGPRSYFPLGVFETGHSPNGNPVKFTEMLVDLKRHAFDSIYFTNNWAARDVHLLAPADCFGFNIILAPLGELNDTWYPDHVPATLDAAKAVLDPVVDLVQSHPSLRAYSLADEPRISEAGKVALAMEGIRQLDPKRAATVTLIGLSRIAALYAIAQPDVMVLDVYPFAAGTPPGEFGAPGGKLDFVSYIRTATTVKPEETPLWLILQAHRFEDGPRPLREPVPTEIRAQHWLGIGEGATGIFWFMYSSRQSWNGLVDNPPLYQEAAVQARRTSPLRDLLLDARKDEDRFSVHYADGGEDLPYAGTLRSADGQMHYVVVVNMDVTRARPLVVESAELTGYLLDLENGSRHELSEALHVEPGNGRIFALIQADRPTAPTPTVEASTPDAPEHGGLVQVTLTTTSDGAEIYYTLDGTLPTRGRAARYNGSFLAQSGAVLRARSFQAGHNDSEVTTTTLRDPNSPCHALHLPMVNR